MKIHKINNNIKQVTLGLSRLLINTKNYKGCNYTLYREFFNNKLEVSTLLFHSKQRTGFRLKHISNEHIIRKIDNIV